MLPIGVRRERRRKLLRSVAARVACSPASYSVYGRSNHSHAQAWVVPPMHRAYPERDTSTPNTSRLAAGPKVEKQQVLMKACYLYRISFGKGLSGPRQIVAMQIAAKRNDRTLILQEWAADQSCWWLERCTLLSEHPSVVVLVMSCLEHPRSAHEPRHAPIYLLPEQAYLPAKVSYRHLQVHRRAAGRGGLRKRAGIGQPSNLRIFGK